MDSPSAPQPTPSPDPKAAAATAPQAPAPPFHAEFHTRWIVLVIFPVLAGIIGSLFARPFDLQLSTFARNLPLGGDVKRELEALQQFGGFGSILVTCAIIWAIRKQHLRRCIDWFFAAGFGLLVFNTLKMLIGRARPNFASTVDDAGNTVLTVGDPSLFFNSKAELVALGQSSFAMPSTHTTHAFIAAMFISSVFPKLRAVVFAWAALVACARITLGAHWASDVALGAGLGIAFGHVALSRYWGVRSLDYIWCRFIDKKATPAFPAVYKEQNSTSTSTKTSL